MENRLSYVLLLSAMLSAFSLRADVTGSILGVVRDASGGVLPGVTVTATNLATNQTQSARTDTAGEYRILALPIGNYKIEASSTGFQKFVTTGIDLPNLAGPVQIQNPRLAGPNGPNEYFLPSAFTSEPLGGFGSSSRAFFSGPGLNNWDFSLHKDTAIREHMAVQFRAEFFNIFNHTQFNNPNGNFNSSQFGLVASAQNPRIGQLSLKFLW